MKNLVVILLALVFGGLAGFSQNPGNVGTPNLTAWFRADNLTLGNVTTWTTTFPTGGGAVNVSDVASPYPQATNTPVGGTSNYNTTINFSGNSAATLRVLENGNALNLLDNTFSSSQGTFFAAYYLPTTSTQAGGHIINYREGSSGTVDAIQFRCKLGATTGRFAIGSGGNSTNASHDYVQDYRPDIVSYSGNRSNSSSLRTYQRSRVFTGGGASSTTGQQGLYVGARKSGGYNGLYDGFISELIFYNRDLTALERNKVHTYLGVKYSITLDNTGGGTQGDYLSTTGTTIWDASLNPAYHNEVIGIGRDDTEGLLQKQSHTFNDGTRIYIGALQTTNVANTGTFSANGSYVIIGNNLGGGCASAAASLEVPPTPFIFSRIAREWKVTKSNFGQPFNCDLELSPCATAGGTVDPANLRLLVDTDGNFTNANVFAAGGGLTFSYANGRVTVSGISNAQIPDNSTRYITIGYAAPEIQFVGSPTICDGDQAYLLFSVNGATGPVNVTYSNGTSNVTVNNVNNGDTLFLSPSATTTYSIDQSTPFNCCNNQTSSQATVTVNPLPVVSALTNALSVCSGDSVLLTGNGATSYVWDNGVTDGVWFYPSTSATYTVTGTDNNGCQNSAQVSVQIDPQPIVIATASDSTLCLGESTVLNASGANSYVWDNGVTNGDTVSPTQTTTYLVVGTNSASCVDSTTITIVVNPLPIVGAIASATSVCEGEFVILAGTGALSYAWSQGVADSIAFRPDSTDRYTVFGFDANGCQDSASVTVSLIPEYDLFLGEDTIICPGLPITLQVDSSFSAYLWGDSSMSDTLQVNLPGNFWLSVTDSFGCIYFDEIMIDIGPDCDSILIPNVFTPNGDGFNDVFQAKGEFLADFRMLIFDRWGHQLHTSTNINAGWDGNNAGGSPCTEGVYFYAIRYSFVGDPEEVFEVAGPLTLLK